ncbi:hypothetical protein BH09VER1_BH09VER1_00370 [soil metagenome]
MILACWSAVLLGANWYELWKPRASQISGDTLIHLVFARNAVAGHPFEYNLGAPSRAMTAPLWNWVLAAAGWVTGTAQDNEGFLWGFRLLSVATLGVALWVAWRIGRRLEAGVLWAAGGLMVLGTNPSTFYWTVANPMETAGAALIALGMVAWAYRAAGDGRALIWALGGLLTGLGFLTRPELVIFGGLAGGAAFLCATAKPWKGAAAFAGAALGVFAVWSGYLYFSGLALLPNAGSARRLMLLQEDAKMLPGLGIPYSPDAILFVGLFAPLVIGALLGLWLFARPGKAAALAGLLMAGFAGMFFSFYFYSTWQGRYMLPAIFALAPVGVAGLSRGLARVPGWLVTLGIGGYATVLAVLFLHPLSRYADAPQERMALPKSYLQPPVGARKILCQEIQSAYFYPGLFHVCTEGLIGLEALEARKEGKTVRQFIDEQRPDLIGPGRYPLKDPDGVIPAIRKAADAKADLELPGLKLVYLGEMAGCGPVFRTEWATSRPAPNP